MGTSGPKLGKHRFQCLATASAASSSSSWNWKPAVPRLASVGFKDREQLVPETGNPWFQDWEALVQTFGNQQLLELGPRGAKVGEHWFQRLEPQFLELRARSSKIGRDRLQLLGTASRKHWFQRLEP